jgi:hypothetical protein
MKMKNLLFVALATLGINANTMAQSLPNYVPSNGLIGWWPFNGNANDESGNGNNGNVNGAILTNDRFGNSNKAYSFDGINDFIEIANTLLPNVNTSFSISFWFNTNLNTVQAIISESSPIPNNTNYKYAINFSTVLNVSTSNGISSNGVQSQSQIITGQWIFGSMVYNSSAQNIKVYFNGIEEGVISNTIYSNQNNATQIGRGIAGGSGIPGAYISGKIDDIGIWNRVLTQQEISDLYNGNICYQNITVTDTLLINMGITGFNPVTYNNTIKIFPNPANNHITIDYGNFATLNGYQLKIENSIGQQVFQTNITQQTDYLSLNNWGGNGLYFVHIIDAQGNTIDIRKIVLQ